MVLCLRDNNYHPQGNFDCQHQMYLNEEGKLQYSMWGTIAEFKLAHNENSDAMDQFHALKKHCDKKYQCEAP